MNQQDERELPPAAFSRTQTSDYFTQSFQQQSPTSRVEQILQTQSYLSEYVISQQRKSFGEEGQSKQYQQEVIEALVDRGHKMLLVQSAGSGKTFVYMTAAKFLRETKGKVTLIISPLLALIRNQVLSAEKCSVSVKHVSSNEDAQSETLSMIRKGQIDALITTPEQLHSGFFAEIMADIGMLVVDEAHCICQWGNNFRLSYLFLRPFVERLERDSDTAIPILAASSTITELQEKHICDLFNITEPPVRGLLTLSNLHLEVVHMANEENALKWLAELVPKLSGSGIIYCLTVAKAKKVAFWLRSNEVKARAYYSSVKPDDAFDLKKDESKFNDDSESYRECLEQQFKNNAINVLVSTSALGMGIDIPKVGYVIVFELPGSLQILYQELGRAGRSASEKAHGIIVYVNRRLPNTLYDTFFAKKDVSTIYTTIAKSSSGMSISELERKCNLPVETIENILIYLSTMKQGTVTCSPDGVWHKGDMS